MKRIQNSIIFLVTLQTITILNIFVMSKLLDDYNVFKTLKTFS